MNYKIKTTNDLSDHEILLNLSSENNAYLLKRTIQ
jgi:hypothetical protein